ncbi:MAG TPA: DsbC family protein [Gammaproteobacteria bacterium]|nr:DsbC family protein [Gammaproteobacteria bacterium]
MKRLQIILILTWAIAAAGMVHAETGADAAIRAAIGKMTGGTIEPDSVKPSALQGLYEVVLGTKVVYVSEDGRYLLSGDLIDVAQGRNISEERRSALYKVAIDSVGEDSMIVYAPSEVRHTVTIFTDIDCPYCRKLHKEMKSYNDAGIKVRYLAFPRAGVGSESYKKAVSVWCAKDRAAAMTRAKNGEKMEERSCRNPVKRHLELVRELGVNATPTIFLEDGRRVPGYVPAQRLAEILEHKQ